MAVSNELSSFYDLSGFADGVLNSRQSFTQAVEHESPEVDGILDLTLMFQRESQATETQPVSDIPNLLTGNYLKFSAA